MSASAGKAVFLSYASQDVEAAKCICEALRTAGVEVWFDQDALVGGDAWDQKIRGQIGTCALFVPIISANTQARDEGYFRLEWKLAVDRSHLIAHDKAFLLPVVVDATPDASARVPAEFRAVQWTRQPLGETPAAFITRVQELLGKPSGLTSATLSVSPQSAAVATLRKSSRLRWVTAALGVAVLALIASVITRPTGKDSAHASNPVSEEKTPVAPVPVTNDRSIAVLPFENLSPDKENEFFADGMHEEVITTLSKIHDLTVIARASVLDYRGPEKRNLRLIGTALGVAHVLEGRVRRAGNQVKVTVELIDARTGKLRWTNPYTEELTNAFDIQSKLAAAITAELKSTLTSEEQSQIARRPTLNQEAYDLYLRARRWREMKLAGPGSLETEAVWEELVIPLLTKATELDPKFAAAFAELGLVHGTFYRRVRSQRTSARLSKAKEAIDTALRLAPALPAAHLALGAYHYYTNDYARASEALEIALVAMPGDADVLQQLSTVQRRLGRWKEGTANCGRAFAINPRNTIIVQDWMGFLSMQRFYARAEQAAEQALSMDPANASLRVQKVKARFARDGDRVRYQSELDALELASHQLTPREVEFRRAYQDGRLSDAVQIYDAATESFSLIARLGSEQLFEYLHAVAAGGDHERMRSIALAAIEVNNKTAVLGQLEWHRTAILAWLNAYAGRGNEARRLADRALELMPLSRDAVIGPQVLRMIALVNLVLGEDDRALALLDQALSVPSGLIANTILHLEPWWKPLHHDPRFKAALTKAMPRD